MATQEQIDMADLIKTTINEHCKAHVIDDFRQLPQPAEPHYGERQEEPFRSMLYLADSIVLEASQFIIKKGIDQTILAHDRMIDLLQSTKEKLEDLKKNLT